MQGGLRGIGGAANESRGASESLSNAIAFGMAKAEIALGMVNQAYGKLQGMVAESANLQLENMSAAQTFAAVAGKSYEEGAGFIDRMNESLSRSAAALPGATKDYTTLARTIQDNLIDGFKDADGQLRDMEGLEKTLTSISESYGVLSAASNVPISNTALGLTKALGGASVAELRQIQAFEQNPAILNEIEKRLQAVGAKTLKDLDTKSRIKLIQDVGAKFVDGDFKKRAADTFDGLWQSFVSSIFDPMTGLFGLSRDLDANTKGVQSAFTSLNELLKNLIGSGGLFEQVSGIMQALGLTVDPMRVLRDGVDRLNQFVKYLNGFLGGIRTGIGEGYSNFGELLTSKLRAVEADIKPYLNGFGFDTSSLSGFLVSTFTKINEMVGKGFSWLIQNAVPLFNQGVAFAISFAQSLNWHEIGIGFGAMLGQMIAGVVRIIAGINYLQVLDLSRTLFRGLLMFVAGAIGGLVNQMIASIGTAINSGVPRVMQSAGDMVRSVVDAVVNFIKGIPGAIGQALQTPVIQNLGGILQNPVVQSVNPIAPVVQAAASSPVGQGIVGAAINALNPFGGIINAIGSVMPKFEGHVPNAANGLIGAAIAESKAMPSGAQVVVANDREFILKPTGRSGGSGGNTFNFIINGTNAKEIAQEVMALIQQSFEAEMNTQLV